MSVLRLQAALLSRRASGMLAWQRGKESLQTMMRNYSLASMKEETRKRWLHGRAQLLEVLEARVKQLQTDNLSEVMVNSAELPWLGRSGFQQFIPKAPEPALKLREGGTAPGKPSQSGFWAEKLKKDKHMAHKRLLRLEMKLSARREGESAAVGSFRKSPAKKLGRPPKSGAVGSARENQEPSKSTALGHGKERHEIAKTPAVANKTRKKRGRPPKSTMLGHAKEHSESAKTPAVADKTRKKRGRPPKSTALGHAKEHHESAAASCSFPDSSIFRDEPFLLEELKEVEKQFLSRELDDPRYSPEDRENCQYGNLQLSILSYLEVCLFLHQPELAQQALKYYHRSPNRRQWLDIKMYNVLMHSWAKKGSLEDVVQLFHMVKEAGLKPNLDSYAARLQCLGRINSSQKAIRSCVNQMENNGFHLVELFQKAVYEEDEWEMVLKTIRIIMPDFQPPSPYQLESCTSPLLQDFYSKVGRRFPIGAFELP
uniref:Uncharacterized protein n=1 Tax=Sphenodon punctatus TaxID=8508 RepID=A0A8D0GPR3_SPHPU